MGVYHHSQNVNLIIAWGRGLLHEQLCFWVIHSPTGHLGIFTKLKMVREKKNQLLKVQCGHARSTHLYTFLSQVLCITL